MVGKILLGLVRVAGSGAKSPLPRSPVSPVLLVRREKQDRHIVLTITLVSFRKDPV